MIRLATLLLFWATAPMAQNAVSVVESRIVESRGEVVIVVDLSDITPYRVFTLDAPRRVILDFQGVAPDDLSLDGLVEVAAVGSVRTGPLRPEWSRVIFDLTEPHVVASAGMVRHDEAVFLTITLSPATDAVFAEAAGAPPDPGWDVATGFDPVEARRLAGSAEFVVLIDPAHGGIDAGITVEGIREADLTLITAQELALRLNRLDGIAAALTRQGDDYVPISARRELVIQTGADLVLVLHAEARGNGGLRVASFRAGAEMLDGETAEEVGGAVSDVVGTILGELASAETVPEGSRVADALITGFSLSGVPVARDPRLWVDLPMLRDLGVPAVAVLLGDLDRPEDRAFLISPEGRNALAEAIAVTVELLAR